MTKRRHDGRCDVCGEEEPKKKLVPVVLQVDGRKAVGWRLCRSCAACKVVLLGGTFDLRKAR